MSGFFSELWTEIWIYEFVSITYVNVFPSFQLKYSVPSPPLSCCRFVILKLIECWISVGITWSPVCWFLQVYHAIRFVYETLVFKALYCIINLFPSPFQFAARFSPDDKYSRQRILLKKRFGLLPTQQPPPKYWVPNGSIFVMSYFVVMNFDPC